MLILIQWPAAVAIGVIIFSALAIIAALAVYWEIENQGTPEARKFQKTDTRV